MPSPLPLNQDDIARYREADVIFVAQDGFKLAPARVRCYSFAKLLNQRGLRAEVLSFFDHLGATDQGGPVYGIPEDEKLRLNMRALDILSQNPKAVIYMQKTGYHALSCFLAAARNGNPIILDYDDYDLDSRSFMRLEPWLPSLRPDQLLANTAAGAAACIASSHQILGLVAPHNPNTHLIHTVADQEQFNPERRAAPRTRFGDAVNILWCGDVWGDLPMKDIFFGVDAFALMPAAVRARARFHIIGFGKAWDELKRRVRQRYPSAGNIVFHEHIAPSEFGAVLSEMDIGVLPYDANQFNIAKSPTKMFEYLLAKVAVCATPVGEATHCLEHGRTALFASGLIDYSRQLARLIEDDGLRRSITDAAHDLAVSQYSLQSAGDRLVRIVRDVMAPASSTRSPDATLDAFLRHALGRTLPVAPREIFLARQDLHALARMEDPGAAPARRWSAPLIAMLDWPGLSKAEALDGERIGALRQAARAHRTACALRPEIALPAAARPDGPPGLCKLAASEDWEDPAWMGWVQRFKTNCATFHGNAPEEDKGALTSGTVLDSIYSYFKRSRGTWERVQLLYGLDRFGLLNGGANILVVSEHVDGFYLFLTQWAARVDVLDIGDDAAAMADRVSRGEMDLWLLRPRMFDADRLAIHHGAPDETTFAGRRWDAVVLLRNALFGAPAARTLAWAEARLKEGGLLAFVADVRLNGGTDAPGLSTAAALGGLDALLAERTALRALGPFDPSLEDATLDRIVQAGAADAGNPHFVVRTGDTLHMPATWFCRKDGRSAASDWQGFADALPRL